MIFLIAKNWNNMHLDIHMMLNMWTLWELKGDSGSAADITKTTTNQATQHAQCYMQMNIQLIYKSTDFMLILCATLDN